MKPREAKLDHQTLTRILDYNAETGVFTWKVPTSNRVRAGEVAGSPDRHGHLLICVNGIRYGAGRLAWFAVHKVWPTDEIDHINLIKDDNRIANLREATHQQNVRNVKMRRNNRTGLKGVVAPKGTRKFVAQITIDGKVNYLGLYDTPEKAHEVYVSASRRWHGAFGRTS